MPEARSLRGEIDSYKDDIASARDERHRELSIKRLADAEGRLEAFLSKPLERNADVPDLETPLNKTPAEQELRLQDIRGRAEREAERETDQANRARAAHETNVAQGSERTPYRSTEEAQSARAAERGMENDAHRPLPADVRQARRWLILPPSRDDYWSRKPSSTGLTWKTLPEPTANMSSAGTRNRKGSSE